MEFPTLIKQSKKLKRIPNPEDFGLDQAIRSTFKISIPWDEFLERYSLVDSAEKIILHPEIDTQIIKSRQEVLQEFKQKKDLTDFVLKAPFKTSHRVSSYRNKGDFETLVQDATNFSEYISNLDTLLSESSNNDFKEFKSSINKLNSSKHMHEIRENLDDVEKESKLVAKINFSARRDWHGKTRYDSQSYPSSSFEGIFKSGEKYSVNDSWVDYFEEICSKNEKLNISYKEIFEEVARNLKQKRKKNIIKSEDTINLEIYVDEANQSISSKATYQKLNLLKTITSGFKKKYDSIITDIEFDNSKLTSESFSTAISYLKRRKYSKFMANVREKMDDFRQPLTELRYLAAASNYFKNIKEKGVKITTPEISNNSEIMRAEESINPNLLNRIDLEKIVRNNIEVDSKSNLRVITGPNFNGKTVYINGVGIFQAFSQAGLDVFAENAEFAPRDNIYSHYIRPGDLVTGDSRYSGELGRTKDIFKKATENSLILMDESYSGTAPKDAMREVDDVIRTFGDLGATTYIATHFHNLIDTANELPYAKNLFCIAESNGDGLVYTHKIKDGFSRESNGIDLARKMGADRTGLKKILNERVESEGLKLRE